MNSSVCLVSLERKDLPFVRDTYNYYIGHSTAIFYLHPLSAEETEQIVPVGDARYLSFLITEGGQPCGFCYIARFKPKEAFDITVEITLYLTPGCEGRGIGTAALGLFEEHIRRAGFSNIVALITGENEASIRLFTKNGYTCAGRIREVAEKFGRRLDLVLFQKQLGLSR